MKAKNNTKRKQANPPEDPSKDPNRNLKKKRIKGDVNKESKK
jgi:hypothetical protein